MSFSFAVRLRPALRFSRLIAGSMWTASALSVFQLLSDDYISYVFFMLFLGIAIGAVQVIAVPHVIEMVCSRSDKFTHRSSTIRLVSNRVSRALHPLTLGHRVSVRSGSPMAVATSKGLEDPAGGRFNSTDHDRSSLLVSPKRMGCPFVTCALCSGSPKNRCSGTPHKEIT